MEGPEDWGVRDSTLGARVGYRGAAVAAVVAIQG